MCLAVPAKVIKVYGERAVVEIGGVRREASLSLVADQGISVGDYVLIHTGFAIQKVDEEEAKETLDLLRQLAEAI
jgi:hydrogenase expression/formation protein HypC